MRQLSQPANQTYDAGMPLTTETLKILKALTTIQVDESKLIVKHSEKEYRISKLSSDFAFAIAIILLVVIQALVFSSKTFHISNKETPSNLNWWFWEANIRVATADYTEIHLSEPAGSMMFSNRILLSFFHSYFNLAISPIHLSSASLKTILWEPRFYCL